MYSDFLVQLFGSHWKMISKSSCIIYICVLWCFAFGAELHRRDPRPVPDKFIDKRPQRSISSEALSPWPRTVSGRFELVTPVVIDGITFSASPRSVKTPTPWVSLKGDGIAKTIVPKVKGMETKNGRPDYDTYFATPITKTFDLSSLIEGHTGVDRYHKQIEYIPEDATEADLNPLIRCIPDRYFDKRGVKKTALHSVLLLKAVTFC